MKKSPTHATQKVQIAPEFKAGIRFEPEAYWVYVEASNPAPNAEIGCKMRLLDTNCLP